MFINKSIKSYNGRKIAIVAFCVLYTKKENGVHIKCTTVTGNNWKK